MPNQNDLPEELLNALIAAQRQLLLKCASQFVPNITPDDLLQPNDYPQLENAPLFRYEEGVLAGLLSAQMALRAERQRISGVPLHADYSPL